MTSYRSPIVMVSSINYFKRAMSFESIFLNTTSLSEIRKLFLQHINVLFIEDHPQICRLLNDDFFCSPVFNKKEVHTLDAAKRAISGSMHFHGWVLDLTLERHNDGLELLRFKPNFPYCVVVSGAESMSDATEALKLGAYSVYDKKNIFFSDPHKFIEEVCSLSILSFLLKARKPKKFEIFQVLVRGFILTPESWSYSCWLNGRTFRRLCEEDSFVTPKQFLALFHALKAIIVSDCLLESMSGYSDAYQKLDHNREFFNQCGEFVLHHLDAIFGPRFLK